MPLPSPICSLAVRHVAAGSHLTVAVTTGGRVFQMGVTGASGPIKNCPWEGATTPELVRGSLQGGLAGAEGLQQGVGPGLGVVCKEGCVQSRCRKEQLCLGPIWLLTEMLDANADI